MNWITSKFWGAGVGCIEADFWKYSFSLVGKLFTRATRFTYIYIFFCTGQAWTIQQKTFYLFATSITNFSEKHISARFVICNIFVCFCVLRDNEFVTILNFLKMGKIWICSDCVTKCWEIFMKFLKPSRLFMSQYIISFSSLTTEQRRLFLLLGGRSEVPKYATRTEMLAARRRAAARPPAVRYLNHTITLFAFWCPEILIFAEK